MVVSLFRFNFLEQMLDKIGFALLINASVIITVLINCRRKTEKAVEPEPIPERGSYSVQGPAHQPMDDDITNKDVSEGKGKNSYERKKTLGETAESSAYSEGALMRNLEIIANERKKQMELKKNQPVEKYKTKKERFGISRPTGQSIEPSQITKMTDRTPSNSREGKGKLKNRENTTKKKSAGKERSYKASKERSHREQQSADSTVKHSMPRSGETTTEDKTDASAKKVGHAKPMMPMTAKRDTAKKSKDKNSLDTTNNAKNPRPDGRKLNTAEETKQTNAMKPLMDNRMPTTCLEKSSDNSSE